MESCSAVGTFVQTCCSRPGLRHHFCTAAGPLTVCFLEAICKDARASLEQYWHEALEFLGYAAELRLPEMNFRAAVKHVVLTELRRRETFPRRLRLALERLGLKFDGRPVEETDLRLLQYRHNFVLDRRYHRYIREHAGTCDLTDPKVEAQAFQFHADTLPGCKLPSALNACSIKARASMDLLHGPFGSVQDWEPDEDLRQRVGSDDLCEGRDIDLCAFAPNDSSPLWNHIWSPHDGAMHPWYFFVGIDAPTRLSYPQRACFGWQLRERPRPMQIYHSMAKFTRTGKTSPLRTASSEELAYLQGCYHKHKHIRKHGNSGQSFYEFLKQFGLRDPSQSNIRSDEDPEVMDA